jgi:hypothetical protein
MICSPNGIDGTLALRLLRVCRPAYPYAVKRLGRVPARAMTMQHRVLNAQAVDPKGRYYPVRVRVLKS